MRVWLERVPLREPSMRPHEILASESQERMLLIVAPDKLDEVLETANKWGVLATAIGEVIEASPAFPQPGTAGGRLLVTWHDHTVVDVPPGSLVDDGPVYARPMREPADLILLQADRAETLPRPATPDALRETVLRMIASPNLCDKSWVTEQYDRYVLGNTVLAQPEDAGVIRIDEETGLGVALSVDGNGRYTRLDPYNGAKLALAESYRNIAVTGARPVAVTNCLNFGSPEDPSVMWQFAEAVRGLADGCAELGIPVTGGNVSFYNQTGPAPIHPTPVVGVLGVLDDVAQRVPMGFVPSASGDYDVIYLLGETRLELSGSEWAWVAHEHLGGVPPRVDLARERALADLITEAARVGHLRSAHDLSDGGLAQTLVEACLRNNVGARIALPEEFTAGSMPFVYLFSESTARAVVTVPRGHEKAFAGLCAERGIPYAPIGVTDSAGGTLEVRGQFALRLDELRTAYTSTMPRLFGIPVADPGSTAEETGAAVPVDAQPTVPMDIQARVALDIENGVPADTGVDMTADSPTDVTTDTQADVTTDTQPDTGAGVPTDSKGSVPGVPTDATTSTPAGPPAQDQPAELDAESQRADAPASTTPPLHTPPSDTPAADASDND
jgi:phosphoribosylformylglycinamidine synthase